MEGWTRGLIECYDQRGKRGKMEGAGARGRWRAIKVFSLGGGTRREQKETLRREVFFLNKEGKWKPKVQRQKDEKRRTKRVK